MLSPFPGMDPYLEGRWFRGLHTRLIVQVEQALVAAAPPAYEVGIGEYVYHIRQDDPARTRVEPDVFISRGTAPPSPAGVSTAVQVLNPPVILPLPRLQPYTQVHLEIRTADTREVVTVLEILSPTNKDPHTGCDAYLGKRAQLLQTPTHLIELDLLRSGARLPMGRPLPPADDSVFLSRATRRQECDLWPLTLQDRLPCIPSPLLPDDPEPCLDLQGVFDLAYANATLGGRVDYRGEPEPPLPPAEAAWACLRVATSGVRLK